MNPVRSKSRRRSGSNQYLVVKAVEEILGTNPSGDLHGPEGEPISGAEQFAELCEVSPRGRDFTYDSDLKIYVSEDLQQRILVDDIKSLTFAYQPISRPQITLGQLPYMFSFDPGAMPWSKPAPKDIRNSLGDLQKAPISSPAPQRRLQEEVIERDMMSADYVAAIVGYRVWEIGPSGLEGISIGTWPPLVPMRAVCDQKCHQAPQEYCQCGMWGFKTVEDLGECLAMYGPLRADKYVAGRVYMWGTAVECEKGWRVEYAYPAELWALGGGATWLRDLYNVPMRVLQDPNPKKPGGKFIRDLLTHTAGLDLAGNVGS